MTAAPTAQQRRLWTWLLLGVVTVLSYATYMHGYQQPAAFFWDENYHVASAQKYLNGIYFMEQHPPLGKMLIALGEAIVDANEADDQFIATDYGTVLPEGFSFAGYRLFPVLFAWLSAPLLFLIFLLLLRNPLWSALLSFFYIFDTALIVHLRGAMLESALLFFSLTTILCYLCVLRSRNNPHRLPVWAVLLGISLALIMTTKVVGLVLILLLPPLLWELRSVRHQILPVIGLITLGFVGTYIAVWHTHFSLGQNINPSLADNGYYQASAQYRTILATHRQKSLLSFPVMLRDSLRYVGHYNGGVPPLDLCKQEENGSPFFLWPVGGRSINYRWETPDGSYYRYLYLQVNPAVWWMALGGLFLAFVLIVGSVILPTQSPPAHLFHLLIFAGIYVSYMIAIARIDRVMYLYHYFLPLLLSFLILGLAVTAIRRVGPLVLRDQHTTGVLLVMAIILFAGFQFYRPLAYYEPIDDAAFERRMIFPWWELRCVRCARPNLFGTPTNAS